MTADSAIVERLRREAGEDAVLTSDADRATYATDASKKAGDCLAVVRASREEQVVAVLRAAAETGFAVVPRGAGTSSTGSARPFAGQVVLDVSPMTRILDIHPGDMVAEVEPGVLTGTLQDEVEARGLFYPPDPASSKTSTLGGNVATCAGGLRAVKYGVTRDYVLGLRGVLMGGEVVETGGRSLKDVVGYDLTRLFVGSEGTLAIFTRLLLRLIPLPPERATILASFEDEAGGFRGADAILASRVLPRALEYLDSDVIGIVAAYLGETRDGRARSRLLVEIDGASSQVAEDRGRVVAALRAAGAYDVRPASSAAERDELWRGRRAISQAVYTITPAKKSEDIGVPRSQLGAAVAAVKAIGARLGIRVLAYGHAGDANLHCNFLYDPAKPGEAGRLERAIAEAFDEVLARGGTISGEHGVGLAKREVMPKAVRPAALRLMRELKAVFDPKGLLNPGKMLPPLTSVETTR